MDLHAVSYWDLIFAAAAMALPIFISRYARLGLEKDLAIGTVRLLAQLLIVGHILAGLFAINRPLPVLGVLLVMVVIAGYNAAKRAEQMRVRVVVMATGVIGVVAMAVCAYMFYVVIGVEPYFNPRYVIPLMGMGLNGAMNAVAVGARALDGRLRDGRERVEAALCVGATGRQASLFAVREALKQAMVPAVNNLMTAGIVQMPGIMTGQIISGVDPLLAVRYQVVIFYLLTVITVLSATTTILLLADSYFTKAQQFAPPPRAIRRGLSPR
ncbi:MAG: ABC transporter permease [Deltaproteobacteria bacterium]|nr:ABC transporter permease [bacterium]MCB9476317.1 ABC transporter permease [Deltaproteobacteria bacterium]MCB9489276.1 ABC transporter permease [Deltaproteobacteria bacterium]